MELKDVVLSTLAEMQNAQEESEPTPKESMEHAKPLSENASQTVATQGDEDAKLSDEAHFLQSVRERLLVLFEGFQSPNNKEIEAKVDLTLNFLEYLLSTIDTRLDALTKGKR